MPPAHELAIFHLKARNCFFTGDQLEALKSFLFSLSLQLGRGGAALASVRCAPRLRVTTLRIANGLRIARIRPKIRIRRFTSLRSSFRSARALMRPVGKQIEKQRKIGHRVSLNNSTISISDPRYLKQWRQWAMAICSFDQNIQHRLDLICSDAAPKEWEDWMHETRLFIHFRGRPSIMRMEPAISRRMEVSQVW